VLGDALAAADRPQEARDAWTAAATSVGDFQDMSVQPYSERTASSAAAWRRLGRHDRADELLDGLAAHARRLESTPAVVDYFATSLPALLLFADDAQARRVTTARFLTAQVAAGRGDHEQARRLLDDVLRRDPNHGPAQDLRRLTA
jgi:tetratricopeptide (TPR) repeat protein